MIDKQDQFNSWYNHNDIYTVEKLNKEKLNKEKLKEHVAKLEQDDFLVQKSVIDGIVEARKQAEKEGIRANCVIISKEYVKIREHLSMFIKDHTMCVAVYPAMICGLKAAFSDELPEEFAFAITNTSQDTRSDYEKLKAENEELKQQLESIKQIIGGLENDWEN